MNQSGSLRLFTAELLFVLGDFRGMELSNELLFRA